MRYKVVMPIMLFVAATLSVTGCANRNRVETAPRVVNVRTQTVTVSEDAAVKLYVGTVRPSKSTVLNCKYPGTLVSLEVSQGQQVGKGDVVAVVESQSVKSALDMANASLEQARDGYDRLKAVYESGTVPEVKMVEIQTQLSQAEASAKIAQQAYDDCTVKAPYSGVVSEVYVDEGVDLAIAEPIVRIVDAAALEITIPIPENEIGNLAVGDKARVTVSALNDNVVECKITKKGISASPLSHSYECTLKPLGKTDGLMPGMVCKVNLSASGEGGIVIPASAVKTGAEGRYVWIVRGGVAERADITVDGFSGDGVVVTSGLSEGDRLITSGAQKVSSGMKVNEVE